MTYETRNRILTSSSSAWMNSHFEQTKLSFASFAFHPAINFAHLFRALVAKLQLHNIWFFVVLVHFMQWITELSSVLVTFPKKKSSSECNFDSLHYIEVVKRINQINKSKSALFIYMQFLLNGKTPTEIPMFRTTGRCDCRCKTNLKFMLESFETRMRFEPLFRFLTIFFDYCE